MQKPQHPQGATSAAAQATGHVTAPPPPPLPLPLPLPLLRSHRVLQDPPLPVPQAPRSRRRQRDRDPGQGSRQTSSSPMMASATYFATFLAPSCAAAGVMRYSALSPFSECTLTVERVRFTSSRNQILHLLTYEKKLLDIS
jgi:hypothetical protein